MNSSGNQAKTIYDVRGPGGRELYIKAKSGETAKRIFCKAFDIRPGDPRRGIRVLTARKMILEEAAAWEEGAAYEPPWREWGL